MADDSIRIRVGMTGATETTHEANKVSRAIDNIGDKAKRASREIRGLNSASKDTRVNFGPFSTSMKGGALAVGALVNAGRAGIPVVLSLAEAVGVTAVGGGAAGAVGMTGLAQATGVVTLGIGGLTKALGGNQTALKNLTPDVRALFDELHGAQSQLQGTAQAGLLPGLEAGTHSALRNLPVVNRLVAATARTIGGLARQGGGMLGSASFGRDLATVGRGNVKIIHDLGDAGLHLADGARHVLVEASPLAQWIAKNADEGARLLDVWLGNERASGGMARFFHEAQGDMKLLASMTGHTGRGLINIFGAQDVNGTKTLQALDRISARFETWTNGPALAHGLGNALADEAPKIGGMIVGQLAKGMAHAAPTAASVFWHAFWDTDALGKVLTVGFLGQKFGAFKLLGKALGRGGAARAAENALSGRGSITNPLYVVVLDKAPGTVPTGAPGALKKTLPWLERAGAAAGLRGALATLGVEVGAPAAAAAAPLVALGGAAYLSRNPHGYRDSQRESANLRNFRPLSGEAPVQTRVMTDAQGFPLNHGTDVVIQRVDLDGERVGTLTAAVRRRRQARN